MTVSSWMEKIRERIHQNGEVLERSLDAHDTLLKRLCGYKYMDERRMQKIQSRDTPTGKCAEFLSWLSKCSDDVMEEVMNILENDKQQHVVNFMKGKEGTVDLPLSDDIRSAVQRWTGRLNACMEANTDLLEWMLSKDALKQREYEAVQAKLINTDKVNALLEFVLRKSMRELDCFICSLIETNQKHVANELQAAIKGLDVAEKPKTETRSEDSNQDFSEDIAVHGTRGTTKVDGDNNDNGFDGSYLLTEQPEIIMPSPERLIEWFRPLEWEENEQWRKILLPKLGSIYWEENEQRSKVLWKDIDCLFQIWRKMIKRIESLNRPLEVSSPYVTGTSLTEPISETRQEQVLVSGHQNSTDDLLHVLREKFCSTESLTTLVEAILIQLKVFGTSDEVLRLFREKYRSRESLTTLVEAILSHLLNTGNQSSNLDHAVNGKRRRSNASQSTQFATNDAFLNILKKRRTHNGTPPFHCFNDGVHNHLASVIQVG